MLAFVPVAHRHHVRLLFFLVPLHVGFGAVEGARVFLFRHEGTGAEIARAHGARDVTTARDEAEALVGTEIAIHKDQLEVLAENEYFWRDLIGLSVETVKGEKLGKIDWLFDTGSNDVIIVKEVEGVEPNTVIAVMQKGYELNGRLIRPAMVMVSKAAPSVDTSA